MIDHHKVKFEFRGGGAYRVYLIQRNAVGQVVLNPAGMIGINDNHVQLEGVPSEIADYARQEATSLQRWRQRHVVGEPTRILD